MSAQSSAEFRYVRGDVRRNPGPDRLLSTLIVHKKMKVDSWITDETHWGFDIQRVRRNGATVIETGKEWARSPN
ncbi:hypothetical protein [Burkholderia stabilis]|uniref:hypothetical protein n=1 Tax=Burkholderia stabilis TaxID=95485 RepID=UPI0012EAB7E2|nr:hypothetical protein [Burkholderia stabilis]HDR9489838.1 hypothetical protein [Burkholderia stabilis]HDR9520933.1 hypothetical protein [Burkholderia stabilis]HDR9528684.1 hypothetical protein [Burkholderia stabilis]HDR9536680.1 hypothetical protein [Burkholderia stabilis]HDR9545948.1 hypothetical protein [Burkholderia stabilis]